MITPKVKALVLAGLGFLLLLTVRKKAVNVLSWDKSEGVINKLHSSIQPYAKKLLEKAAEDNIQLIVTDGLRTNAEQQRLYDQGRTTPGAVVTNAKPGTSWHNHGLAFDVAIYVNGRATWPNDQALWNRVGAIGQSIGLEWGGAWTSFHDNPHFQRIQGLTIAQAQAGERPSA